MNSKTEAFNFLLGLQMHLDQQLPTAGRMRELIEQLEREGKSPSKIRENVFLYYILPFIYEHMQSVSGVGANEARLAMLCEYHSKIPLFASGNPFRKVGHPFRKALGDRQDEIMKSWTKNPGSLPLNQAYPDFCLRSPFPFKIVFDAKYFTHNSESAANKALVDGAYEVMFYRGLPTIAAQTPNETNWDYDYGCLLAYDGSHNGFLQSAWKSVRCKSEFWEGANIFVMIIQGSETA